MGKNLAKKISALNKVPHPKGRKTAQLTKKTLRACGREKGKAVQQMKVNLLGEKLMWFKENLDEVDSYTPQLTLDLIERYLGRFDDELQQIQLKHSVGKRKGRQHASREDIIKMTIKNERNEFLTCGIEMPDVLNEKQLNLLKNWSGELKLIQNFKLVRYTKGKLSSKLSSGGNSEDKKEESSALDDGSKQEGKCSGQENVSTEMEMDS